MTAIRNPASPGAPSQVIAEQPVRNPLAGGIPFRSHATNPAVVGPTDRAGFPPQDQHVRTIPQAMVDAAGGPLQRK
jgi:hypothetical protein